MNRAETRALLERRGLHLRRELGQNFLIDESWAERLVELAEVTPGDRVVEIGTGLGALTRALAKRARSVVTVEIDAGVVRALREEALLPEGVELLHADALELDLAALAAPAVDARREQTRLVANLPYSAATPLLRRMLDLRGVFADWSVMVQREVGLRIAAQPGTRDYGSLAVLHALCTRVELRADLPAECFFPTPKVVSSFLHIEPLGADASASSPPIDDAELRRVERVVRALFGQRRKTLWNGLRSGGFAAGPGEREQRAREALDEVGIEARTRAEQLEPLTHRALVAALHARELV